MKKYGNTNSEGLCTVKNPYKMDIFNSCETKRFYDFQKDHPPLPLYTTCGHLVKDAVNVEVELIWQFKERGMYESKEWKDAYWTSNNTCPYNSFDEYSKTMGLSSYNCDTRQIYRLLTVPPTGSDLSIGSYEKSDDYGSDKPVFGQMDVMKNIIANKQSDNPAPMSSKGIKSADIKVFTQDLSAYQYFRANAGDKFDGEVWYKGTIDHVVTLMEGYAKQQSAHHAQFETEVRGNNKLLSRCQEILMDTVGFNHIPNDISQRINELISLIDNALKAPSNNSSSEMVKAALLKLEDRISDYIGETQMDSDYNDGLKIALDEINKAIRNLK